MSMHTAPMPNDRQGYLSAGFRSPPFAQNLGQPQTSVGFRSPSFTPNPRQAPNPLDGSQERGPNFGEARSYGLAEALSQPIEVQSGHWLEAVSEGLAGGLRGRAARNMYENERDRTDWAQALEQKQEAGERGAYSDALAAALDPSTQGQERNATVARALSGGDPRAAFEFYSENQPEPLDPQTEAVIASLPPEQQALARLNPQAFVAGMMRNRFPAPSRAQPYDDATGDDWEAF